MMRTIAGHVVLSQQLLEQTRQDEAAMAELEWTASHPEGATPEQRARLDRFRAAQAAYEDDY